MGYQPIAPIMPCPACGFRKGEPRVRRKGWFSAAVRIECPCGVAGAWRANNPMSSDWRSAAPGWALVAGKVPPGKPPAPISGVPPRPPSGPREPITNWGGADYD